MRKDTKKPKNDEKDGFGKFVNKLFYREELRICFLKNLGVLAQLFFSLFEDYAIVL